MAQTFLNLQNLTTKYQGRNCLTIISGSEEVLVPKFGLISDLVLIVVTYYLFILLIARMTRVCKSALLSLKQE